MKPSGSDQVEIRLPRKPEFVRVARMMAVAVASMADFTYDIVKDIETAVGEACNNAVEHVCRDACKEYTVAFMMDESDLIIEVRDRGQGFDIAQSETGPDLESELDPRGFGILIIKAFMDDVEIVCSAEGGTCVRMRKHCLR